MSGRATNGVVVIGAATEIRVLGPVGVVGAGGDQPRLSPKQRSLLALLAACSGGTATTQMIVDELWGDRAPRTALATVHTYVSQLRSTLARCAGVEADDGSSPVRTEAGGYRLDEQAIGTDVERYARLDAEGRAAAREGDPAGAARLLRAALDVWRGPTFSGVEVGGVLSAEAIRLGESRTTTTENWVVAELALGHHTALLGELHRVCALHPLHETMHGYLMLALHRSGRRAEALATMRTLRARLVEEVGIEPAGSLMELQQAILAGDPALADPMRNPSYLPGSAPGAA